MKPEEHYAEAERLLKLARLGVLRGAPVGFSTHEAVAALAHVHATLALYRPPFEVDLVGFTPGDTQPTGDDRG